MTKSKLAIIDFDDTLFDAEHFKKDIASVFTSFGVSPQIFWESYKEARDSSDGKTLYTFDRHLQILTKDYIFIDIEKAKSELDSLLNSATDYLFPDSLDFLNNLKKRGLDLILLSLGEENFQFKKLEKTGLNSFFKQIFLVNDSKLNVLPKILNDHSGRPIFINDKIKETKEVAQNYPHLYSILKTRSDVPLSEYQMSGLPFFNTLAEALTHLESII